MRRGQGAQRPGVHGIKRNQPGPVAQVADRCHPFVPADPFPLVGDVLDHTREHRTAPESHRLQVARHIPHQRPRTVGGLIRQRLPEQVRLLVEVTAPAAGRAPVGALRRGPKQVRGGKPGHVLLVQIPPEMLGVGEVRLVAGDRPLPVVGRQPDRHPRHRRRALRRTPGAAEEIDQRQAHGANPPSRPGRASPAARARRAIPAVTRPPIPHRAGPRGTAPRRPGQALLVPGGGPSLAKSRSRRYPARNRPVRPSSASISTSPPASWRGAAAAVNRPRVPP